MDCWSLERDLESWWSKLGIVVISNVNMLAVGDSKFPKKT